jgi:hypothetical protein
MYVPNILLGSKKNVHVGIVLNKFFNIIRYIYNVWRKIVEYLNARIVYCQTGVEPLLPLVGGFRNFRVKEVGCVIAPNTSLFCLISDPATCFGTRYHHQALILK